MEKAFNEGGVMINQTYLNVTGQSFPLQDVKEMKIQMPKKGKLIPALFGLLGLVLIGLSIYQTLFSIIGILVIGIGLVSFFYQKNYYSLFFLMKNGLSREVLNTNHLDFAQRVIAYIEEQKAQLKD